MITVETIVIGSLGFIELARFAAWANTRAKTHLANRRLLRRGAEARRAVALKAERAQLIRLANRAKWDLLTQAQLAEQQRFSFEEGAV